MPADELFFFFFDTASAADFPPLMTCVGVSSLEELEISVTEALPLDEEEASAGLDALQNESAAAAQNVVASSALA